MSLDICELTSLRRILPLLFGLALAFTVVVVGLVPSLLLFSDTPLGRFLTLVEVVSDLTRPRILDRDSRHSQYTFLLHTVILDHQLPIRDSLSFDSPKRRTPDLRIDTSVGEKGVPVIVPASAAQTPGRVLRVPIIEEPALPERIVVRRSSRLSSWLGGRRASNSSDSQSLTRATRGEDRDLEAQSPASDEELESFDRRSFVVPPPAMTDTSVTTLTRSNTTATTSDALENVRITFTGGLQPSRIATFEPENRGIVPDLSSTASRKPSLVRPGGRHTRVGSSFSATPSIATYDARGIRLSSPNLDLEFSIYGNLIKQQREREDAEAAATVLSPIAASEATPPPSPKPPPSPPESLRNSSLASKRPSPRPVQPPSRPSPEQSRDRLGNRSASSSDPSPGRRSETSLVTSDRSSFSLSRFPEPPDLPPAPEESTTPRALTSASAGANIVTEGGLEFELFPPRLPFGSENGRESFDSDKTAQTSFDVTSLIVGDRAMSNLQRQISQNPLNPVAENSGTGSSDDSSGPTSPMPTSPAPSELAEILQATVVRSPAAPTSGARASAAPAAPEIPPSRIPTRSRKESVVTVEEVGRVIPPRTDQDAARRKSPALVASAGFTFGLPSNPRRKPGVLVLPKVSSSSALSRPGPRSSSSSDQSPVTAFRRFSSSSESGFSPDTSIATYDPARPFERPRPAPLVLIREERDSESLPPAPPMARGGGIGPFAGVAQAGSVRRTRSRGGRRKDITVIRGEG